MKKLLAIISVALICAVSAGQAQAGHGLRPQVVLGGGGSCAPGYVLRCNVFGHCYCSQATS